MNEMLIKTVEVELSTGETVKVERKPVKFLINAVARILKQNDFKYLMEESQKEDIDIRNLDIEKLASMIIYLTKELDEILSILVDNLPAIYELEDYVKIFGAIWEANEVGKQLKKIAPVIAKMMG